MDPIRVLIADDHTLIRAGLRLIIEKIPEVEVVAEASDGREALQLIAKTHPNVVLMDISMSNLNGLEATAYISQDHPEVHVIILSMHSDERHVVQAVRAGAVGYLLKDAVQSELEVALRSVMRGDVYLSAAVSKYVLTNYRRQLRGEAQDDTEDVGESGQLTAAERELLQMIAEGHTTKEIAAKLHLSVKAIEARRARLMDRLDIRDLAGLVRYAIRIGLVSAET